MTIVCWERLRRGARPDQRLLAILLLVIGLVAAGCDGQTSGFRAERFDVQLRVHDDGSMTVREEIVGPLDEGARFRRLVELFEADQLVFLNATADGERVDVNVDDRVLFRSGRRLSVAWPAAAPGVTHSFTLEYRARAAVQVTDRRGRLQWPVLPYGRTYPVDSSAVVLVVPETSDVLDGTGIAEAGWTVERQPQGIRATRTGVGLDGATVLAEFSIDPRTVPIPDWQMTLDMREQFGPAFVAGGLFMIVIGAGIIWIIWFQHPAVRQTADAPVVGSAYAGLPPALAAAVARGRLRSTIDARSATLLALSDRRDPATGESRGTPAGGLLSPRWEHERVVSRAADADESGDPMTMARRLSTLARQFDQAVARDLEAGGLVDAERLVVAQGLRTTAAVVALFALACAMLAQATLYRFGWWPQVIPVSMLIVSVVLFWFGRRFSIWTREGVLAARWWREKVKMLDAVQPRPLDAIEQELPLAVAVGLGPVWLRRYGAQLTAARRHLAETLVRARGIPGLRRP